MISYNFKNEYDFLNKLENIITKYGSEKRLAAQEIYDILVQVEYELKEEYDTTPIYDKTESLEDEIASLEYENEKLKEELDSSNDEIIEFENSLSNRDDELEELQKTFDQVVACKDKEIAELKGKLK